MENQSVQALPGLLFDIDGVLIRDGRPIPGAERALKFIKTARFNKSTEYPEGIGLPFSMLTNSGGKLEISKAHSLNSIFGITKEEEQLQKDEVMMNFTALRPILENLKPEALAMIDGYGEIENIMEDCGAKRYVTFMEYAYLFPNLYDVPDKSEEKRKRTLRIVSERLKVAEDELSQPFTCDVVVLFNEFYNWKLPIQVICDLVRISKEKTQQGIITKPPVIYDTNNDFVYSGAFWLPRMAMGTFNIMLEKIYKKYFGEDIVYHLYCKPELTTFTYAKEFLTRKSKMPISNFYMIGDNPNSDIQGANNSGVVSILVKTGVFKGPENDAKNPAKYIVNDVVEALELIAKLENLNVEI